jgi:AraC-type DNA-binding domain-containing proteins
MRKHSLLQNFDLRVSEIAFAPGFQSLSQFNQMFKRVFGQSPTEFRAHLGTKQRSAKAA